MDRRTVLRTTLLTSAAAGISRMPAVAGAPVVGATKKPMPGPAPRDIVYRAWTSTADFATGGSAGVDTSADALRLATPVGQQSYTDPTTGTTAAFDYATWTSPLLPLSFAATNAITSWTADTPSGTWIQSELRGVTALGNTTAWYVMGRWAADDGTISRTSLDGQADADGDIATDTFIAAGGHALISVQVRATLYRLVGLDATPTVRSIGVVASSLPAPGSVTVSTPQAAQGIVLDVPRYSQDIHAGQYPQWSGGGESWCSPTSTSMIVAFWGTGPTPPDYSWVDPGYADPWIDYAARNTFDYAYAGTGNWPFNTAYAGRFGIEGFVTRLRSLNEAEAFIAAGIPLALSLSFKKNQIPGLNYATGGHLLVLAGFSATGQPILNDPASPSDAAVRKTAGRAQFEAAWLDTSGGTVYVIHPAGVTLPPAPPQPNW